MKLYVIGNGFDRGHGLETSYWDFRTYLEDIYPEFLYEFEQHYDIYPMSDFVTKKELLWNELESNLANIDEQVIIEQAVSIDMNLESGDIGIEDTLYQHFSEEYKYIQLLSEYLKQWVGTISIGDAERRTLLINDADDVLYITFNYTLVLEEVYEISEEKIVHIHGSLSDRDDDPVLGHGNKARISEIKEKIERAEREFNEKEISICNVLEDYYTHTFKNVDRYMFMLYGLSKRYIDEIIVIGHSLAGVDVPYFSNIDVLTHKKAKWKVYYYCDSERQGLSETLVSCGIDINRIEMIMSDEFYNL